MADATDYLLHMALGALQGTEKAFDRKWKREDEDALTMRKIKAEEESKLRVLEKTPREVWNPKTQTFQTHIGQGSITQLKEEQQGKTLISNNEFNRRTKAGETLSTDKYQVVPESYAGEGSPFVDVANKRLIADQVKQWTNSPQYKSKQDFDIAIGGVNTLIEQSRKGNQVAFASLGAKMAKVNREVGMLSTSDVTRYVEAKGLARQVADKMTTIIEGKPTDYTLSDIEHITEAMRMKTEEDIEPIANEYAQRMSKLLNISPEQARNYMAYSLPNEEKKPKGKGLPPLSTPSQYTPAQIKKMQELGIQP